MVSHRKVDTNDAIVLVLEPSGKVDSKGREVKKDIREERHEEKMPQGGFCERIFLVGVMEWFMYHNQLANIGL